MIAIKQSTKLPFKTKNKSNTYSITTMENQARLFFEAKNRDIIHDIAIMGKQLAKSFVNTKNKGKTL